MATTDEIIVRFKAEGGETVEEAFRRVGSGAEKVGGSTDRAGKSLDGLRLKSDERVARNLGAIAQEMARGGGAADVMAVAVSRLGESFKGAFLIGAAGAIGVGLYETITRTGEAMIKLNSEVARLSSSKGSPDFLGTDQISKNLSDITAQINAIYGQQVNRSHSLLSTLLGTGGGGPLSGIVPALNAADQAKIDQLRRAAGENLLDLTSKTKDLNKVASERLNVSKTQAELDQAEIEHNEKLGQLARSAVDAGLAGTDAARESLRVENDRYNILVATIKKQAELVRQQKELNNQESDKNFFRDVGSGAALKRLQQEAIEQIQEQRGRELIAQLREAQAKGTLLGPNARALLDRADKESALAKGDFTGVASLAGLKFEGLRALDGLSIIVR